MYLIQNGQPSTHTHKENYTYWASCIHAINDMHICIKQQLMKKRRGHVFKREQGWAHGRVWNKKRKRGNDVVIVTSQKFREIVRIKTLLS